MSVQMRLAWTSVAMVAAFLATGCGGDGGGKATDDPGPAAEAIEDAASPDGTIDEDAATSDGVSTDAATTETATGDEGPGDSTTNPETAVPGKAIGQPCARDSDCEPAGKGACLGDLPFGYCVIPGCAGTECPAGSTCIQVTSGADKYTYCMDSCTADDPCRDGYTCDADVAICWYDGAKGLSPVGGGCQQDADCADKNAVCYPSVNGKEPTGFVNGYCVVFDCTEDSCPAGAGCFKVGEDGSTACLPTCESDAQCRQGYACSDGICFPACAAEADCPLQTQCYEYDGDKVCVDDSLLCGASNPAGFCPAGLYCIDATCQTFTFECTDETFEPNDTVTDAKAAPLADFKVVAKENMQVCTADKDWFTVEVPEGKTATFGAYFIHQLGDLDVCAYEGSTLLGCRYDQDGYPGSWRGYDWNDEFLSVYSGKDTRTIAFKVQGYKEAQNEYDLYGWLADWKDGAKCTDLFSVNECKGCLADGQCVKGKFGANLVQFPFPDPDDPFVGAGYVLESSSGYRWLRREAVMLIRWAIAEVRKEFHGTEALGLIDMADISAITPGFDVGDPRHPESTHDEGGNIDVAYFRTDTAAQGYNAGGVICDAKGTSTDGYYCTNVDSHVVDLPRTAYFLGKLAESDRFRVAGCDQKIAPLLLAELKAQREAGKITQAAYNKLSLGGLAYGSGWPFHHHHLHLSLNWWGTRDAPAPREAPIGCGYRMPGDGTWAEHLRRIAR